MEASREQCEAVGLDIAKIIEQHKSVDFRKYELCTSNLCHRLKTYGPKQFIEVYSKQYQAFHDEEPLEVFLFYISMLEHLANQEGIELSDEIKQHSDDKYSFPLYCKGVILMLEYEFYTELYSETANCLNAFKKHNIMFSDLYTVI